MFPFARLFAEDFFDVDALPHVTRNAMSRRKCGERWFGGGVDAPLRGVAVLLGGWI